MISLAFHATLMALVVGRLVSELRRMSRHDGLTGLLNRRAMEEALDAQARRSRRNREPFVVMMLDLDHFKAVNDRHGHAVGDRALKQVSAVLRAGVREVDRIARFGGEEFLVLLPGATLAAALPLAERLREQTAVQPLLHAGARVEFSVSIGIAEWLGAQEDLSRLLQRADAVLYQAKHQGRNRVEQAASAAAVGQGAPALS